MKREEVVVGATYSYFPLGEEGHFPAQVLALTRRRIKVRLFREGAERGEERVVNAARLADHGELFPMPEMNCRKCE